mmetsp:Transcript_15831/g.49036  ORF Transcript_15831/g.49036 Transcript_15831/m.49036 type:complete len:519 (+) Transcript_15831:156-1712(+)
MSSESPLKPHVQKAVSDAESGSTIEVPSHEPPRKFFSLSSFDDPVLLYGETPSKPARKVTAESFEDAGASSRLPTPAPARRTPPSTLRGKAAPPPRDLLAALAVGGLAVALAIFWTPAVDAVLPTIQLVECTTRDPFEPCHLRPPAPACVDEACAVTARPLRVGGGFSPLVVSPAPGADASARALVRFLDGHRAWARSRLETSGAVLYRGFDVANATDFEEVATALEAGGDLATSYLGTSPRDDVGASRRVKTAADLPPWKMIPVHAEMSFAPAPPQRLYFYSHVANTGPGGETPLADLRAVLAAADPAVRRRLSRPLKFHRVYFDATTSWPARLDPTKTKSWQAMFGTSDPAKAIAAAARAGYDAERLKDGSLRLSHVVGAPTRRHAADGAEVWHSHMTNIDSKGWAFHHAQAARDLRSFSYAALALAFRAWYGSGLARRVYLALGSDVGQRVVDAATGLEPSQADADYVRALMAHFTSTHRHAAGDVLALDNFRVGHGRTPWDGSPRQLWAAWSDV